MTRPHQRFGFKEPIGRQIPRGALGWGLLCLVVWVSLAGIYVTQTVSAAPRGDQLQKLQNNIDQLQKDVLALEDTTAKASSLYTLAERAQGLGLVQTQNPEYINPAAHAFVRR
jgi:Tfp pilus assembly protein PilN